MTEQKRYSLSDSDIVVIFDGINGSNDMNTIIRNTIVGTWNAILAQEGMSWDDFDENNQLDIRAYEIPNDQITEIAEAMKKRLFDIGISPIGVTNAMMEFVVQYGPTGYEKPIGAHPTIVDETDLVELDDFPYVAHKPHSN